MKLLATKIRKNILYLFLKFLESAVPTKLHYFKDLLSHRVSIPTGMLALTTASDNQVNVFHKNGKAFCQMAV